MQHKHAGGRGSDHSQRAGVKDAQAGHRMGAAAALVVEDGGAVAAAREPTSSAARRIQHPTRRADAVAEGAAAS